MMNVILTAGAKDDLAEINEYISNSLQNPDAAKRMIKKIVNQLHMLERFPEMGAILLPQNAPVIYRYLVCGSYMAFYHITEHNVQVDRILYGRRNYLHILFGNILGDEEI